MKTLRLSVCALLVVAAAACTKSNNNVSPSASNITVDDAADIAASSLATNSNGMVGVATDISASAQVSLAVHINCGTTVSDSSSHQSAAGAKPSYSLKSKYSYTVFCNANNQPDSIMSTSSYTNTYADSRLMSSGSGNSVLNVGGLAPAETTVYASGTYNQSGSYQSETDTSKKANDVVAIKLTSLVINKHPRAIKSGSATISVIGSEPKKGTFSFTGTIVFNADGTATLTLNGTVYTVDLTTGIKTKH